MRAKFFIPIFAVASLCMASCTSDSNDPDAPAAGPDIRFRVADTRAAVVNSTTIRNTPFEVYGEFVQTNVPSSSPIKVFNATKVSYTDGAWKYDDPQYWFPNTTYSFVAMHPAVANIPGLSNKTYTGNQLSFTYTLPEDYKQATDLLIATHRRQYTSGTTSSVAFNFSHILSRLNFVVNVSELGQNNLTTSITINRLVLRNVCNSATYSATPAPITIGNETEDYSGGWSTPTIEESNATLFDINPNITVQAGRSYQFFPLTNDNSLIAIPQLLSENLEIEITYTKHPTTGAPVTETATGNLYSVALASHGARWSAGQSYTYYFTLGGEEYILFNTPTVQSWNESEGGSYIITD